MMQDYFRRFRALRGKGIDGVAHDSLQRSWCAMIVRWNWMLRESDNFVAWLANREEVVGEHSLRDLRTRVCTNAWNDDRICYVQVREGCAVCGSSEHYSEMDWSREVAERPLGESEQSWIAKYRRALNEWLLFVAEAAALVLGEVYPRRRVVVRALGRHVVGNSGVLVHDLGTRGPRPGRPGGGTNVAPTYPRQAGNQASELDSAARGESRGWTFYSHESGYEASHEEGPRAPRGDPRSSAFGQPSQQLAEGGLRLGVPGGCGDCSKSCFGRSGGS
ncbi:LOW QUALITY PROTEIN: Hypothetical protein PHPALM_16623 [Phytophthora palmivora]|uniref:Uncharacterized protein n=1 Tax=Phytophthora palmivora TaxID=4796 RepID=A0A2P4XPA1_9STRA|nr:LOW QUALITY PROTEIN: Hypothetical protein PHPALM_16623 [Phytophthora palmivora]